MTELNAIDALEGTPSDKEEDKKLERPFEYGFILIKNNDGNIGISPADADYPPNVGQIYDGCSSMIREIDAQDIANTVAMKMMQVFQQAEKKKGGLVVPKGVPRR